MIKPFAVFVTIIVIIAVALYFPQILNAMHGMSILEAMQQAVGFVLHVVVVSILAYGAYVINELVQPWVKTFRQKQRHLRRSIRGRRGASHPAHSAASTPKVSRRDDVLLRLITQLARDQRNQQQRSSITKSSGEKIHWE